MPGQKITEADRKKINAKFICSLCRLLLSGPMQTPCGHLMCYDCLQKLLSSPNPACPTDGTQFRKEEVFLDNFTLRELMTLYIHCPNEDCGWSGTYEDLQDHSLICDYALIQCVHGQCKKNIKRSLLAQHLETECFHRQVTCEYCDETLAFNFLQEHVNFECLRVPVTCEHCGVSDLRRTEMEQHETVECDEIPTECEFKAIGCNHTEVVKRKELRQHCTDASLTHMQLLLKNMLDLLAIVQNQNRKMEIVTTLQAAQEKLQQLMDVRSTDVPALAEKSTAILRTLTALQKRVENQESRTGAGGSDSSLAAEVRGLKARVLDFSSKYDSAADKIQRLEIELRGNELKISEMQDRLDRVDLSLAENTSKLCDIERPSQVQTTLCFIGTLLWRITDFKQKRREAISGAQTAIYSPHFYTSQFGYKMCARVYMNGDGFGKDTHISLFFVVMKGEYDALLPWPFQKKITMMLLDQNNGDHMIDAFRSDAESSSFQRPENNMNIASGSPLFMPLDGLSNRAYVKDDTMFIKIIVD